MSNMSYCRYQNTANDVADCVSDFTEELERDEHNARIRMINHMIDALEQIGYDITDTPHINENILENK